MGKEKKRKRSRSPSDSRRREQENTDEKLQKMQCQLDNLTSLFGQVLEKLNAQTIPHRNETGGSTEKSETGDENDKNAANSTDNSGPTEVQSQLEQTSRSSKVDGQSNETPIDLTVDEEILQILGDDPNIPKEDTIKIHPAITSRWKVTLKEGLSEEVRKALLKKYPRTGNLYTEPPKVNLEIQAALSEISKKRDQHFVETQECVGSAVKSLATAVSALMNDSEEGIDQLQVMELLCDTGKILADVFHQQSLARKSFITPIMNKNVKPLVDSIHSDEWLYGHHLADQIKEAKTIENACQQLKAPEKRSVTPRSQNQGNWSRPSAKNRQAGRRSAFRFKPRQYRSNQSSRDRSRSTKDSSAKKK